MITLITGQPGNGKTSYVVWHYIKKEVENRVVYYCGIPKLKLPAIQVTREKINKWHELQHKKNPEDEDEVQLLSNFDEGSLIVIDEVQKSWSPEGSKVAEPYIQYLTEHRHHGLDFVIMTQYPHLVHKTVRALVSKHIHIRSAWSGRQLLEWPEWRENPIAKTNINDAAKVRYKLITEAFDLYESASIHTKLKHRVPKQLYIAIAAFLFVGIYGFDFVSKIYHGANGSVVSNAQATEKPKTETTAVVTSVKAAPVETVSSTAQVFENVQLVSTQYDWSKIAACTLFRDECRCYGDEAERLVIPDFVCRAAVSSGWSGRGKPVPIDSDVKRGKGDSSPLVAG